MRILVTGGAGFIGSHVVDALRERGCSVVCLDSLEPDVHPRLPSYLRTDVEYMIGDLRHVAFDSRLKDVEAVVHLAALGGVARAAREPSNIIDANVRGTARLVDAARGWSSLRAFVLAGSFSVYGSNYSYECVACGATQGAERSSADLDAGRFEIYCRRCGGEGRICPIDEHAPPAPLETYGASKYMQELCLRGFQCCPVHVLRFSSVYGSRLRLDDGEATIIARLAGWIRSGKPPKLFEDGRQMRDWVYVGDIVSAVLALLDSPRASSVTNACSGAPTRLDEACEILQEVLRTRCPPEVVGGYRPGDMRHCLGNPGLFKALLGREPRPFKEGARLAFGGDAPSERA